VAVLICDRSEASTTSTKLTRIVLVVALAIASALTGCGDGASGGVASRTSQAGSPRSTDPQIRGTMRLLQFNVLNGATGDRAAAVIAVIKDSGADVVTLDEVNDPATFNRIATATGYHAVYVRANDGYNIGFLSRTPIRTCDQFREAPLRHAAYGCRIKALGRTWWIFGTHLYPFDESVRAQEVKFILSQMRKHNGAPMVLAGDLNSDTPGETDGMGTQVIPILRQAGYSDVFRDLYSFAQDHGFTSSAAPYGAEESRVDYVFRSEQVRSIGARLIDSVQGFVWPSDHKALLVTLGLRSASLRP
jgi:endonuclease/exonuclease/phosphatase family metal-dependent hydrolase